MAQTNATAGSESKCTYTILVSYSNS